MRTYNLKLALKAIKLFCEKQENNCKTCPLSKVYCAENFKTDPCDWNTENFEASNND